VTWRIVAPPAGLTTQLNGLRLGGRVRFETGDNFAWYFTLDEALNITQKHMLIDAHQ
jgi:hypothetical protein